ncbi:hypothetical protein BDZ88DRAFT_426188 [Geranomyces variabilis]|nr:hypothetical protein BDZ88DRAFT_426188 [Geranomyces variabilis]KAJ3134059.1 hypothetical protein HDU90_005407 [Geranomyces variabilis]
MPASGFLASLVSTFVLPVQSFLLDKKADKEWKAFSKRWAESDPFKLTMTRACFARVLRDKLLLTEFEAFAENSHFGENLHFYTAIAGLEKELQPIIPNYRTALTRFLSQTQTATSEPSPPIPENLIPHFLYLHASFLTADAATDLNLPGGVRARSQAVCSHGATIDVFDEAADEVLGMLYFEGFRRFVEESNQPTIPLGPRPRQSADDVFSSLRRPTRAASISSRRTAVSSARSKLRSAFARLAPPPPLPTARQNATSLFHPQQPPVAVASSSAVLMTVPTTPPRLKLHALPSSESAMLTPPPTPPPRRVVPPAPAAMTVKIPDEVPAPVTPIESPTKDLQKSEAPVQGSSTS